MEKSKLDPIKLECCACGKQTVSDDIFNLGWSLHETKSGLRVDLCRSCHDRQDGREEQERQILGHPPQRIPPLTKNEDVPRETKRTSETSDKVVGSGNCNGITVRARFKLESIDVVVGDTLISGDMIDSKEITLPMSGSDLKIGDMYHVALIK